MGFQEDISQWNDSVWYTRCVPSPRSSYIDHTPYGNASQYGWKGLTEPSAQSVTDMKRQYGPPYLPKPH